MKILFLDDDETRQEHARRQFIGHDATHVRTSREAIQAILGGHFDATT